VSKLQTALLEFGYRVAVDGVFGEHTKSAVVHFQNGRRLIADGVVGNLTWDALLR
jgi:peptidoglycan hydrolase-like protein with peptidoglycan-binding domain